MFATSLIDIARSQSQLGQLISLEGSGVISRLRNQVVATFLEMTTDDWLLQIDTDQTITIDAFKKLIKAADKDERPIISGVVHAGWESGQIYPEPVPCIFKMGTDGEGLYAVHDYPEDSVIEIDAAGTGCILVHRRIWEEMRDKADKDHEVDKWCWYRDMPLNGHWVGEDIFWSIRIKALGHKMYAHTGAQLKHQRRYWMSKEHHSDYSRYNTARHQSIEQTLKIDK
jgi:GT2 family glycosyltransferase